MSGSSRALWTTIVVCAVTALMVGCGGPKGEAAPQPTSAGEASSAPSGTFEIGVVPKGLTHEFWQTVRAGADAAGSEFGVNITWQGPSQETEVAKQISIIEDMINRKVNAIVMAACDENALVGTIQKAVDAGIPVITIDSGVKSDLPVSFVATDNVAGAKIAARELARLVGEQGEVGLIPFVAGAGTSEMREQGFREGIQEFPNITLASVLYSESDANKAMDVTQDMLTSVPNLKGIFAASEPSVVGCAQAIKAADKAGHVKLVGFDASEEEIARLKDGTIQALVVQNPFQMGYLGVKAAVDVLNGRPVEKRIDTGVTVVTMENFDTPEIQKLLFPLAK